jgi:hypothetical protein
MVAIDDHRSQLDAMELDTVYERLFLDAISQRRSEKTAFRWSCLLIPRAGPCGSIR